MVCLPEQEHLRERSPYLPYGGMSRCPVQPADFGHRAGRHPRGERMVVGAGSQPAGVRAGAARRHRLSPRSARISAIEVISISGA